MEAQLAPLATNPLEEISFQTQEIPAAARHHSFGRLARGIGRVASRMAMPLVGAYAGLWISLHGAEESVTIGDMRVEASSDVGFHEDLNAEILFQDPAYGDSSLGSITFPSFLEPLPIGIDVRAYPKASTVEAAIYGRYTYALDLEQDAHDAATGAITDFRHKAMLGIGGGVIVGLFANELASYAYRRQKETATVTHPLLKGVGYSALATMILAGGGAVAFKDLSPNFSHYEAKGALGLALSSPDGFSNIDLRNPVLNSVFQDFQNQHACPASESYVKKSPSSLTVTTYNIKRGSLGIEKVADELSHTSSDIIFLQEVTPESLSFLSEQLGMTGVEGWTIDNQELVFGNAILTRLKVVTSATHNLPSVSVEQRNLLTARLISPSGEEFIAASTHLTNENSGMSGDANEDVRITQASAIKSILDGMTTNDQEAVIIGGDMNQGTGSEVYKNLTKHMDDTLSQDEDVAKEASFPSNGQRFDIILTNTDWRTEHASRGGSTASDHCSETVTLHMSDGYAVDVPLTETPQALTN